MNKIIPPIQQGQQGPAVANLQEALLFIVDKHELTPNNLSLGRTVRSTDSAVAILGQASPRFSQNPLLAGDFRRGRSRLISKLGRALPK